MALGSIFETDPKLEAEGRIYNYGEGTWVKCARSGGANKAYTRFIEKEAKRLGSNGLKRLTVEQSREINQRGFAQHVVKDWGGELKPGVPLGECTPENVLAAFKALPDFFDDLAEKCNEAENYRAEAAEEIRRD